MKRRRSGAPALRRLLRLAGAGAAAAALCTALVLLVPLLAPVLQQAALFSAMLTVPEQSAGLLERRFAGSLPQEAEPLPSTAPDFVPDVSSSASEPAPDTPIPTAAPPEIPEAYRGTILEEDFSAQGDARYLPIGGGYLNNYTTLDDSTILSILETPPELELASSGEPLVLIMHTHATESYEPYDRTCFDTRNTWRSTDNRRNVVAVGNTLAQALNDGGIPTLHDTTQHDYPSYNGSYERSAATVRRYLETYPSIRIVIDVHRDATERGGNLVKPITTINGQKAAQLMIIAGCDDGTMNMPDWRENLRFAALLQNRLEQQWPTLMRPLFFAYRKYNQDLSTGSLLFEFGSHANTLEECQTTAQIVGEAMAKLLKERMS